MLRCAGSAPPAALDSDASRDDAGALVVAGDVMGHGGKRVVCGSCGEEVPSGSYCVRCGELLPAAAGHRGGRTFAAAPHERALVPVVISTIFPQLPRASMQTFRGAFLFGVLVLVVLVVAGAFPIALVAATVLVPLLTALYLYDVDLYEDEPIHVLALTMAWGAAAGVGLGLVARFLLPTGVSLLTESTTSALALRGVVLPLTGLTLMLAGPLVLLPYRKFNDVLDGATFGAASAVAFVGAEVLTLSTPLLGAGVRPVGEVFPWLLRILELGVALPLLGAGSVGAVAGTFWLRYRAPVRDRAALGFLGRPSVAVPLGAVFAVAGAMAQLLLSRVPSLLVLVTLALLALLWLRRLIHLGLLQEAAEIEIGPEISCANCGAITARHSFCARCGISLRALPKARSTEGRVSTSASGAGA